MNAFISITFFIDMLQQNPICFQKEPFASFKLIIDVKKNYYTARVTAIYMLVAPVNQAVSATNFNVLLL